MFQQIFNRLFKKSKARMPGRRTSSGCSSVRLEIMRLEDRTVLSDLIGTANSFAVMGGSTVTNTGPSVIRGDLGVSPGIAIIGFPPGTVVPPGTTHAGDAVALQAQSDITIAYNDLAGRPLQFDMTGQDLGGRTLTPGVYHFSSSAQLTGTVTLDFQGNSSSVFIFQVGSTLITASNSSVVMINGGSTGVMQGCEVYWQVGSSATLGTETSFVGNIVALTSITLNTGADIVYGRALARNGAVTLDNNEITAPACRPVVTRGTVSGVVFNDLNGNGLRDSGEPGLPGATIFIDLNGNNTPDAGETRITDASGTYSFTGLVPGTYVVTQILPNGTVNTTPNPITVGLTSEEVEVVNFGDFIQISITGAKFQDVNGNGLRDVGDAGLSGWTIFLDTNGNGAFDNGERSTITGVNGVFTFTNVGPGAVRILEVRQLGWVQMTNNPTVFIAASGANVAGRDFGNALASALISPSKLSLIGRNMTPGVLAQQARIVENLYFNLLGRAPDLEGLRRYARLLQAGFNQAQVTAYFRADYRV